MNIVHQAETTKHNIKIKHMLKDIKMVHLFKEQLVKWDARKPHHKLVFLHIKAQQLCDHDRISINWFVEQAKKVFFDIMMGNLSWVLNWMINVDPLFGVTR
jgi:hypothetical protein